MENLKLLELIYLLPEITMVLGALVAIITSICDNRQEKPGISLMAISIMVLSLLLVLLVPHSKNTVMEGLFIFDGFAKFAKVVILVSSIIAFSLTYSFYKDNGSVIIFEIPILFLLACSGMMLMVSANSLLSMYMALELQSLSLYILAASNRKAVKSSEAGLKYFVLSALASGLLLYGCSLIYGFTGTTKFNHIANFFASNPGVSPAILTGLIFIITAIFFKLSAVPFHMWTPDVYEGSPMPVTAFFASASKIAALFIFIRINMIPFLSLHSQIEQIIIFVSIASMLLGAFAAIKQTNIKRLIAYSSIGHVGYALIGLVPATQLSISAVLIYIAIYATMTLGLFACIMMIKRRNVISEEIDALSGIAKTNPMVAFAIAIFMLSMAGIPPFAGFFGKFFIFTAAIEAKLYILAVIGLLSSVVAAFYYIRIIKIMYFDESSSPVESGSPIQMRLIATTMSVFNLFFFLFVTPILFITQDAAANLF